MARWVKLEAIRQEITAVDEGAAALCDGLREEELAWRPAPGRWSIAENLLHMRITTKTFLPSVDEAIERARRQNLRGEGPFRLGLLGRFFVWYVEPPSVVRLPSPRPLRPLPEASPTDVLERFLGSQRWMIEGLEQARGLDIVKARVVSPLASFIRMDLLAFFLVFTGHERRHLWQAGNVRRELMQRQGMQP